MTPLLLRLARFRALSMLLLVLTVCAGQAPTGQAASTAAFDQRFGAVEAFRASGQADEAGVRWTRIVFWWSGLQPNRPKSWNGFYFPDDLLQAELASGRQVVGLLINTPSWAGDGRPTSPPRGLGLPADHQDNFWANFARSMAERYRGRIDHWVIWNEPDIWDPASSTYTWSGTPEQFYQLQKVGYQAIKRANPNAVVGLSGLTYWWDYHYNRQQYFERLLNLADADPEARSNGYFFDAAVLHLYNEPEGLYRAPTLFRQLMAARGLEKPIWINETNVAPWDDPSNPMPRGDFRATLDEQASFVIQAFAWGLAAGAERISIYPFSDGEAPRGTKLMGMVRGDGSTRPAYRALQTVTRYLGEVREASVSLEGDAVKIRLRQPNSQVTVAWSAAPRSATATVPASRALALLVDKLGQTTTIASQDGAYRLSLPPATTNTVNGDPTLYLIGGSPLLVVEGTPRLPAPEPSAPNPQPARKRR